MGSITAQVADDGTPYGAAQALQVRASFRIGPYEAWTYPGKRSIAFVRVGERLNGSCACNQADCNVDQCFARLGPWPWLQAGLLGRRDREGRRLQQDKEGQRMEDPVKSARFIRKDGRTLWQADHELTENGCVYLCRKKGDAAHLVYKLCKVAESEPAQWFWSALWNSSAICGKQIGTSHKWKHLFDSLESAINAMLDQPDWLVWRAHFDGTLFKP